MSDSTTPVDHRQRAEHWLDQAWQARLCGDRPHEDRALSLAQVHATLAVHDALTAERAER